MTIMQMCINYVLFLFYSPPKTWQSCYCLHIFSSLFYYWPSVQLVLNLCVCNRKATSNNPVMDNTITSGPWYITCPLVPFLSLSGKWTPPVSGHLPSVPGMSDYGRFDCIYKILRFLKSCEILIFRAQLETKIGAKKTGFTFVFDFFPASSFQLLKLENLLRWSLFTFIYNRSTNMNYFI